ncbi:Lrp/AsnC family transcriptional regulator [Sphingomonas sp. S-NIH.Pt15_0812]|uniref:Lrp/AsnC family transcriptional regulator n=1 Tax=Sphingomonas sp. S-NIH.Pt15_0812 TaxID=1920129 RepID=UPI000F7EE19B|nr:Lrp/AsnC family transcriptional regulator [Sphingomonas sp. S-NIH.Pt15_0812]RSU45531.1 Lrp/AsnC family transcriptional regulator [Sphingomonas sp. S-NIH.Pt15_0812]
MDSLDRKLLKVLQADTQRPMAQVAEEVGLSTPACYRRVRQLRAAGIIDREVAIVRPRDLGWPLTLLTMVTLEREGARTIEEMKRVLSAEPEVLEAWNVTGDHDLVVRIVARDMEGYDELVQRLFSADDRVRSFKTLVVIREIKPSSPVPVDEG